MEQPTDITDSADQPVRSRRDRGSTFIELLVAIVLLGTGVVAVIVSLQATTVASTRDVDHARAFTWLQTASDQVFEAPRIPCAQYTTGDPAVAASYIDRRGTSTDSANDDFATATVWAMYKSAIATAPRPEGWAAATIQITAIEYLGKPNSDSPIFEWGDSYCFEGVQPDATGDGREEDYRATPLLSQKVTIQVKSPNGAITKSIETVKSDR